MQQKSIFSISLRPLENEMNRALSHLCAHIGQTGPGEPPEDGEMNEMTLSSRHRIWNLSPGGLRPSTLLLGHGGSPQYWLRPLEQKRVYFQSWARILIQVTIIGFGLVKMATWTKTRPTLYIVTCSNLYVNSYSAGIDFSRQSLTSVDVSFWRLKSITAL